MSRHVLLAGVGGSFPPAVCSTASPDASPFVIVNDSTYNGFPDVCRMADDRLLLVYRSGSNHAGAADGVLYQKLSSDDGGSWGPASTMWDPVATGSSPTDARDVALATASSGTVLMSTTLGDGGGLSDNFFAYLRRSTDNGATWGTPIAFGTVYGTGGNHREVGGSRIVELPGGTLMAPIAGRTSGQSSANESIIVVFSTDDGLTWGGAVTVASSSGHFFTEPVCSILPGGTLMILLRDDNHSLIYRTTSSDNGATWSTPVSIFGGKAKPAHHRFSCGTMVHVSRANPNGDTIYRRSTNDGVSWTGEQLVDATGIRNLYAGMVSIGRTRALCLYGIENSATDADIRSQVFTAA